MPAKLREELGEHFTVTKGLDGCLSVYPEAEWKRLEDKIRTLGNGEKARRVKRYYFANAFDAQLDAQGRILIPANLRTFAELQKDVTVIGQLDHAEIWNSDMLTYCNLITAAFFCIQPGRNCSGRFHRRNARKEDCKAL